MADKKKKNIRKSNIIKSKIIKRFTYYNATRPDWEKTKRKKNHQKLPYRPGVIRILCYRTQITNAVQPLITSTAIMRYDRRRSGNVILLIPMYIICTTLPPTCRIMVVLFFSTPIDTRTQCNMRADCLHFHILFQIYCSEYCTQYNYYFIVIN